MYNFFLAPRESKEPDKKNWYSMLQNSVRMSDIHFTFSDGTHWKPLCELGIPFKKLKINRT